MVFRLDGPHEDEGTKRPLLGTVTARRTGAALATKGPPVYVFTTLHFTPSLIVFREWWRRPASKKKITQTPNVATPNVVTPSVVTAPPPKPVVVAQRPKPFGGSRRFEPIRRRAVVAPNR